MSPEFIISELSAGYVINCQFIESCVLPNFLSSFLILGKDFQRISFVYCWHHKFLYAHKHKNALQGEVWVTFKMGFPASLNTAFQSCNTCFFMYKNPCLRAAKYTEIETTSVFVPVSPPNPFPPSFQGPPYPTGVVHGLSSYSSGYCPVPRGPVPSGSGDKTLCTHKITVNLLSTPK